MRTWKAGEVKSVEDIIKLCHDFSNKSVYKCGIDPYYYEEEYHKILCFHIKSVQLSQFSFMRIPAMEKSANEVKCPAYKCLIHDLKKRTLAESRAESNFHNLEHDCNICHHLARRNVSCMHSMKGQAIYENCQGIKIVNLC